MIIAGTESPSTPAASTTCPAPAGLFSAMSGTDRRLSDKFSSSSILSMIFELVIDRRGCISPATCSSRRSHEQRIHAHAPRAQGCVHGQSERFSRESGSLRSGSVHGPHLQGILVVRHGSALSRRQDIVIFARDLMKLAAVAAGELLIMNGSARFRSFRGLDHIASAVWKDSNCACQRYYQLLDARPQRGANYRLDSPREE
jgi:hypothetical protein